ncbi:MAG: hypothetical protein KF762_01590 [Acidobacteria bacterium]|nr:hypothetical protein [Acidobacteriota bacterium]
MVSSLGKLFFIGIPGPEIDSNTRELLDHVRPGGVCLFARNIKSAEQVNALLLGIRDVLGPQVMLSVDQEGGSVDRLRRIIEPFPAAEKISTAEEAAEHGSLIGRTLRLLGFNLNFAPVVDVATESRRLNNNGLRGRSFGRSVDEVVELAGSFLDAMEAEGIAGCLKHFPGLAGANVDSHEELPQIAVDESEFASLDLPPFRSLIEKNKARFVMVAHAVYPNLALQERDRNGRLVPSSLSGCVLDDLLRGQCGFEGVAVTDDLLMGAITREYGLPDACVMAVAAGEDMLAICSESELIKRSFERVAEAAASGELSEARIVSAIARIDQAASTLADPIGLDMAELESISARVAEFKSHLR